ncbi:hypothetical protein GCM10022204_04830 [Microlunatus aurantiacus]|uniref:Uncharacterized protein n=1 Tax=Microlunatus aurantiacus TaxID=446786 RepID=A0ABP7CMS8_9ACTN
MLGDPDGVPLDDGLAAEGLAAGGSVGALVTVLGGAAVGPPGSEALQALRPATATTTTATRR